MSVPGVYAGFIHGFLFGDAVEKGLIFKMGQTHPWQRAIGRPGGLRLRQAGSRPSADAASRNLPL